MLSNLPPDSRTSYSAMGYGRHDYEACYRLDSEWELYSLHCHDFYEFYIHFQGVKFYCIDNQVYPINEYDPMFIPPFHMHGLIGDNVFKNYERCFLYISRDMLKVCGVNQLDLNHFFNQYAQNSIFHFHMNATDGDLCKRLIKDLMQSQSGTSPLEKFDNFSKLLRFLSVVCSAINRAEQHTEPIVVNEAMQDVLAYINEHYTTTIKLETLARQFGVSVSFLSHEFVKYTGRSVYDYVLYRRVLLAKELIVPGRPLNEVAYQCGFNDYSSFLRTFTKMTGISPSAYRKGHQLPTGNE